MACSDVKYLLWNLIAGAQLMWLYRLESQRPFLSVLPDNQFFPSQRPCRCSDPALVAARWNFADAIVLPQNVEGATMMTVYCLGLKGQHLADAFVPLL